MRNNVMKFVAMLLLVIVATSCKKDDNNDFPSSDYELSTDGKTLVKWLNPETTTINMQTDSKLKEVTSIGKEAFKSHQKLTSITFSDKLNTIKEDAFFATNLTEIIIPENVTMIEREAFSRSKAVSVTVKGDQTTLGSSVFSFSPNLKKAVFEKGIKKLSRSTFHTCTELEEVNFNDNLEEVGETAFSQCFKIRDIKFAKNTTAFGELVFAYCHEIRTITIPFPSYGNTWFVPTIGNNPFFGLQSSQWPTIYVDRALVNTYKTAVNWETYAEKITAIP